MVPGDSATNFKRCRKFISVKLFSSDELEDAREHTPLNQEDLVLWRPRVSQFEFILGRMPRHSLKSAQRLDDR